MIKYPPVEFWKHFKQAKGAMSASEAIFMYNACLQVPDNGILVEAGTAYGKSALVSLMAWVNKGEKKFWLLEPEFKNIDFLKEAASNIKKFKQEFGGDTICLYTPEYSFDFFRENSEYGFLFWDSGSHGSELVSVEKPLIENGMVSGGVLVMHDVFSQFIACTEAYNSLLSSGNYEQIHYDWGEINSYVLQNGLEDGNNSWHQYPELPHPPNFIGALKRK